MLFARIIRVVHHIRRHGSALSVYASRVPRSLICMQRRAPVVHFKSPVTHTHTDNGWTVYTLWSALLPKIFSLNPRKSSAFIRSRVRIRVQLREAWVRCPDDQMSRTTLRQLAPLAHVCACDARTPVAFARNSMQNTFPDTLCCASAHNYINAHNIHQTRNANERCTQTCRAHAKLILE